MFDTPPLQHAATPPGGGFITPLRYPGGKGRLGPWLAEVIRHNKLTGGWYVEPYAGGAGAALYLLTHGLVEHVVINDADPVIHAFWYAVVHHTDELVRLVRRTPVTMTVREKQLAILQSPSQHSVVEVGFAAFFLNRTSRSGILQGGVIGGKAQSGTYRLDARFNTNQLISRMEMIGSLSDQISVHGIDAMELLMDAAPGLPERSLVYLDPPYYAKGSQLYTNHYQPGDHAAIAQFVRDVEYPVLVTYDDCAEVRALYSGTNCSNFSLHYSTHLSRPKTQEVLFYRNVDLPCAPTMTRSFYLPVVHKSVKHRVSSE